MANAETKNCTQCGAPIDVTASSCKYCGAETVISPQYVVTPPQPQYAQPQPPPQQAYQEQQTYYQPATSGKSKIVAGILAIFLGGLGVHKFYLGKIGWGILYLVFCWTYIPEIIGVIEGIIYLTSSDEKFEAQYASNR